MRNSASIEAKRITLPLDDDDRALPMVDVERAADARIYTGKAVVYFVIDSAKCDDAPATAGCPSRVSIRKSL